MYLSNNTACVLITRTYTTSSTLCQWMNKRKCKKRETQMNSNGHERWQKLVRKQLLHLKKTHTLDKRLRLQNIDPPDNITADKQNLSNFNYRFKPIFPLKYLSDYPRNDKHLIYLRKNKHQSMVISWYFRSLFDTFIAAKEKKNRI